MWPPDGILFHAHFILRNVSPSWRTPNAIACSTEMLAARLFYKLMKTVLASSLIAVAVLPAFAQQFTEIVPGLPAHMQRASWVSRNKFHLYLNFLA